jgi:hypothetical protein
VLPDQADRVGDRIVGKRPSQRCAGGRGGPRRSKPLCFGEGRIALDAKLAMDVDVIVANRNVPGGRRSGGVAGKAEDKKRCPIDTARLYGSCQQRCENRLQRQSIGHHPDKTRLDGKPHCCRLANLPTVTSIDIEAMDVWSALTHQRKASISPREQKDKNVTIGEE